MKFDKVLFWDIDMAKLDFEKNARQIIERALMYGDLKDWFEIKNYYGIERLKKEVLKIRCLDKKTLNFCSMYFEIPLEQFRCYNSVIKPNNKIFR